MLEQLQFLFQQEYVDSLLIYGSTWALKLGDQGRMLPAHLVHCSSLLHCTVRVGQLNHSE